MNDGNAPDDRPYSLYQVLTLFAPAYMESLVNDGIALDGLPYNL